MYSGASADAFGATIAIRDDNVRRASNISIFAPLLEVPFQRPPERSLSGRVDRIDLGPFVHRFEARGVLSDRNGPVATIVNGADANAAEAQNPPRILSLRHP
jgi:hypothetical protein